MKHIKITSSDGETYCGVMIGDTSAFQGAEAATLHGKYHGGDPICDKCLDEVILHLNSTREQNE